MKFLFARWINDTNGPLEILSLDQIMERVELLHPEELTRPFITYVQVDGEECNFVQIRDESWWSGEDSIQLAAANFLPEGEVELLRRCWDKIVQAEVNLRSGCVPPHEPEMEAVAVYNFIQMENSPWPVSLQDFSSAWEVYKEIFRLPPPERVYLEYQEYSGGVDLDVKPVLLSEDGIVQAPSWERLFGLLHHQLEQRFGRNWRQRCSFNFNLEPSVRVLSGQSSRSGDPETLFLERIPVKERNTFYQAWLSFLSQFKK